MLSALLFATTIYAQTEQQKSDKVKRTDVVVIDGYLKVYPEDLGELSEEPIALISQLNKECKYGYNTWRVPTQREINMIRSNGYASDQKYMTQSDYNGILLLVTTQETEIEVNRNKLPVRKSEISVHAGYTTFYLEESLLSIGFKYRYKPFEKYDIRLLGEIGNEVVLRRLYPDIRTNLPIIVGVNYEYRMNEKWSVFGDLGFGFHIPISKDYKDYREYIYGVVDKDDYDVYKYKMGYTLSPEIGFAYNNFMFSFKVNFSDFSELVDHYYNAVYSSSYESGELLVLFSLRLGYRF